MADQLSMNPRDEELLSEITLLTDLIIAANDADGRVDSDAIDRILGIPPPPSARAPIAAPFVPHQRADPHGSTPGSRRERARAVTREAAFHRRAVHVHESAVAKFTELGHLERAEAARSRLRDARKLLHQALQQEGERWHQGYAAMGNGSGPDAIGHAVAGGSPASVCGLEVSAMVGVSQDFSSLPAEQQCPECSAAIAIGR
jgi:hypothetical protein